MPTITRVLYASKEGHQGLMRVQVDPSQIQTALGRWLAETVETTDRTDEASIVRILLPATEIGMSVREMGERLIRRTEILSARELEGLLQEVEVWATKLRAESRVYGRSLYGRRIYEYRWPVYRPDQQTPESYWDEAAGEIRGTGGAILYAGLSERRPPTSLVRTMAGGRGAQLIESWSRLGEAERSDHGRGA
jgi:hypothetical protein